VAQSRLSVRSSDGLSVTTYGLHFPAADIAQTWQSDLSRTAHDKKREVEDVDNFVDGTALVICSCACAYSAAGTSGLLDR
jgi:hypothetical protein